MFATSTRTLGLQPATKEVARDGCEVRVPNAR